MVAGLLFELPGVHGVLLASSASRQGSCQLLVLSSSSLDVSLCDVDWFLLWEVAVGHLGPLATVVLVLSPVSFSMMFFKYCFVEFWLCLPLYYFSLIAERKSWIDLRRAFILVVYAFLVYFFNQVARAVNLCFAVSTALVMPSCCTSYLSGTYL